ncbi:hypothetical protein FA15DRAFT_670616 [Coprinopsis marcescibilis]|uniref:Integral membrane protein n=1 Tax=Coprinopsis marcescibilis TaxID=230819 RepID=A0A5C3KSV6_COPMA|nr:hypothetical protein FA15DRAFT_670616 [Coprinopsis marcescibilis]
MMVEVGELLGRATPWEGPQPLTPASIPPLLAAALTESLLYGIHAILFAICVYLLVSRTMRLQWVMLCGICVMFVLSTADIGFTYHNVLVNPPVLIRGTTATVLQKFFPKFMIFVTNNLIGALLLIARFYVVWGQKKGMAGLVLVFVLIATGFGYSSRIRDTESLRKTAPVYFLVTLVLNVALTFLTAGRIWWISRNVRDVVGRRGRDQYRVTSAIIVESGLLYSVSMILTMGLSSTPWVQLAAAIMMRMVSITPVLMVVQIAIGHATRTKASMDKTADIENGANHTRTVVLDTIIRTGPGSSSMELTSDMASVAGHEIELEQRRAQNGIQS